jgi:glycosyltransferase involved in cell wall biosynthesis
MAAPIRVLQIVTQMNRGGMESRLMDIYRYIDREKVQFDFYSCRHTPGAFDDEIVSLGGKIYYNAPLTVKNLLAIPRRFLSFLNNHRDYLIVHCHLNQWCGLVLLGALRANVPIRIAHSRNSFEGVGEKNIIRRIVKIPVNRTATHRFAVSMKAAEWLYGRKEVASGNVRILPNAINTRKYLFNHITREKVRKDLGLSDKLVVGHIGRLTSQKNHKFLLKVFSEIVLLEPNSVLLLVGKGELEESIKNQCSDLGIEDKVRFLGVRSDVPELFPSFYEGLPGVILEAQAAGLPCVISDKITREARITDLVEYLSLSISAKEWAETVLGKVKSTKRRVTLNEFINAGFDIEAVAKWYQEFYLGHV